MDPTNRRSSENYPKLLFFKFRRSRSDLPAGPFRLPPPDARYAYHPDDGTGLLVPSLRLPGCWRRVLVHTLMGATAITAIAAVAFAAFGT